MDLLTGATGYIGGRLMRRLLDDGRDVRALARDPAARGPAVEVVQGDVMSGAGPGRRARRLRYRLLPGPLDGAGRERAAFADRDRRGADNFARARTGGGRRPHRLPRRAGAARRRELAAPAQPPRGRGDPARCDPRFGRPARLDRDRRRLVVVPPAGSPGRAPEGAADAGWRENRTQPIDERDAIEYLARAPLIARRRRPLAGHRRAGRRHLRARWSSGSRSRWASAACRSGSAPR